MIENETERVYLDTPPDSTDLWSDRYFAGLTRLTPTARAALSTDSAYILDRGIFGAGEPGAAAWPDSRVRTGLVMGSVQSGKTASMFGVTAMALDRGVNMILILAGTRTSLWRQTYERLTEQLDAGEDGIAKATRRLLCPAPSVALTGASNSLQDTYRLPSAQVRRKLAEGRPLIVVAMKQTDHLYALGNSLRSSVFEAIREVDYPIHLLVLDDEADDGSVLDAAIEAGQDPLSPNLKQIPRAIADLWDPRSGTAPTNLFTTYLGYTATPQANLLQEDQNPLSPRDFVISLRTPLDIGSPVDSDNPYAPRSSTYPEPTGIGSYYTGGEVYYGRGASAGLCLELTSNADHDLGEALRAFLVAGAIRLHRDARATGPFSIAEASFETQDEALAASPEPHSMLFHPSANTGMHFAAAEDVLLWAGIADRGTAKELLESGDARLPDSLIARLDAESPLWEAWIDRYRDSSSEIAAEFNVVDPHPIPDWTIVRHLLETEVIPGTRVSVVNSDVRADDRPEYKPYFDETTLSWRAARDLSTIFVSGNVMARGLTLEGMTTALFQRGSANPFADTQMQMQRWFGYRGNYIELCRVFATSQQIELFGAYHDIDEALREGIAAKMAGEAPSPVVLHGIDFLATGKIANLGRLALCSSAKPFVTVINDGKRADPNAKIVADLFTNASSADVIVGDILRGRALTETLSLTQAADLLDSLVFDSYHPSVNSRIGDLWAQVQARVASALPLPRGARLYRPPGSEGDNSTPPRTNCPYAIAAYLRLWDACLTRSVRGLFVTGVPSGRWSMVDLRSKQASQPKFTVGVRYGAGAPIVSDSLADLGFSIPATMKRVGSSGDLGTTWGANDPTAGVLDYRGDEFFDYYHRKEQLPSMNGGVPWRPSGSLGQILFYINQLPGQLHPVVAVGVCIPAGGPEQFAAIRAGALVAA
jgi:hypothetical protein